MAEKESPFTPKEIEYMAAAMMSLKDGIPTNAMINSTKFTAMTGLTDGSSKVIWNKLRQKLIAQADGDGVSATPKTTKELKAKKTPAMKRKADEADGATGDTPTKKPRARKPNTPARDGMEKENVEDEVEDEIKDEVKQETIDEAA